MDEFPRRFGPYVLVKPLARGGMGALYLALFGTAGMEKLCVVKTALPHLHGKGYLQRFRDEAKVVVRLSHGNLVGVFDAGQAEGEIYLAMDFVEGKDLRAVWNRCAQKSIAFPVDVAVHIVKELARGLAYAHSFGGLALVHRDVSPPNVLVSYTGEVKLTDFGLASSTLKLEKTAPGVIYGKVSYMAPEQARGDALDGRADIYGAGIILWELLTGRQLFPGAAARGAVPADGGREGTDDDLLERVRQPQVQPPSKRASRVPAELDRIAGKALATSPSDRYQTGEELRLDLAAFLAKTSPSTDGEHVARFLRELFGDVIDKERAERTLLAASGAALLPEQGERPVAGKIVSEEASTASESFPAVAAVRPDVSADSLDKTEALETSTVKTKLVGSVIGGRYHVLKLCGEGGMGRVYEAEHIEIGKRVAVKVLHPAYSRMPEVVERFRREARAASKIGHPNIVNVTDSGTTRDGSFFFVMEFIEGIELGLVVHREGSLPFGRALSITVQMCRALQAAHDAGVIHRDLKPENVLLVEAQGQTDFVKVLDFGIAKSAEVEETTKAGRHLTRPGVAMGTPEYMAPEQAAGKPADPRSDIYAVGSILYEMLSGSPPYDGENVMEVLHKKANLQPKPLHELRPDVPAAIEALVERAMARSPDERPQTMGDLAREIEAILPALGDLPVAASTAPRRETELVTPVAVAAPLVFGALRRIVTMAALGVAALGIMVIVVRGGGGFRRPAAKPPGTAATGAVQNAPAPPPSPVPNAPAITIEPITGDPLSEAAPAAKAIRGGRGGGALAPAVGKKLLEEGNRLLGARRYGEARVVFAKLVEAGQNKAPSLLGLAAIAFQEKNYVEAARMAKQSVAAGAGASALNLLGDAYYRQGNYRDAVQAYEDALRRSPDNAGAKRGIEIARRKMP